MNLLKVVWMMLGGTCSYPNQHYKVSFRNGTFVSLSTGTGVSNLQKLKINWRNK